MTTSIDIPIRPGAALNDPETRRHIENHILDSDHHTPRRSVVPKYAFNAEGIVNILANYPWQEFRYKVGRWQKQPFAEEIAFLPFLRIWQTTYTPVQLLDPKTGTEAAQITNARVDAPSPSGTLLFAGDSRYAGVISLLNENGRHIAIVGSLRLVNLPEQSIAIGGKASELTKTMTPERAPDATLSASLPKSYLKTLGPWIADHPEKPPRKGVAGTFNS